jgi:hypothetical protein
MSVLLPTEIPFGDAAGSNDNLTFGTPVVENPHQRITHIKREKSVSNWAAPLLQYSEEQGAVIRFLWTEVVKTTELHRIMLLQQGDSCRSGCSYSEIEEQA